MRRSHYSIVEVWNDRVFIVDLNLGGLSVTNDAERVWEEIQAKFPGRRPIYKDTMNQWDEICGESRLTFAPYNEELPE
jgi:hypothetical protein